jgi:hypothetical protein
MGTTLVCSLIVLFILHMFMYHTLIQNIQILGKTHFYNFSDFEGIEYNHIYE